MRSIWLLAFLLAPVQCWSQNRPLKTEWVETVGRGVGRFEFGFEFLQDAIFRLSGLRGDLTRLGVLGLRLGAGENVEIQFDWTAQNFLNIDQRSDAPNSEIVNSLGKSTSDVGDLVLSTKIRLFAEEASRPALGFRFGVELPNASNESGLGNDQTNFYTAFLLGKKVGPVRAVGNLGLAILGDPTAVSSQNDLFTYGVALVGPVRQQVAVIAEINGRVGPGGVGTEEQNLLRIGAQIEAAGLVWDVALLAGLNETDPSSGVILGISRDFKLPSF